MWILDNGIWLDVGVWDDTDFWQDYPDTGVSGSLTAVEAADAAAFFGSIVVTSAGELVAVEAADAAAFSVNVVVSATLAAIEAADAAAFTGTVDAGTVDVSGSLAAIEAADAAAFLGNVPVDVIIGVFAVVERSDAANLAIDVEVLTGELNFGTRAYAPRKALLSH